MKSEASWLGRLASVLVKMLFSLWFGLCGVAMVSVLLPCDSSVFYILKCVCVFCRFLWLCNCMEELHPMTVNVLLASSIFFHLEVYGFAYLVYLFWGIMWNWFILVKFCVWVVVCCFSLIISILF